MNQWSKIQNGIVIEKSWDLAYHQTQVGNCHFLGITGIKIWKEIITINNNIIKRLMMRQIPLSTSIISKQGVFDDPKVDPNKLGNHEPMVHPDHSGNNRYNPFPVVARGSIKKDYRVPNSYIV